MCFRCWLWPRPAFSRGLLTYTLFACLLFGICKSHHLSLPFSSTRRLLSFILVPRVTFPCSTLPFECTPTFVLPFASHLTPSGLFDLSNCHFSRIHKIVQEHLKFSFRRFEHSTLLIMRHDNAGCWHLQVTTMSFSKCFLYDFQCFYVLFNPLHLRIFSSSLFSIWLLLSLLAGFWCCHGVIDIGCCPGAGPSDVQFWVCRHFLV